jgi:AbrB family looped-hinge helix DNA binding protein
MRVYLARVKLTQKYQVTIPKEVREKVHVAPGEVVTIEAVSTDEIRLKRFPSVSDPLNVLIGKKQYKRHVPVEELEEKIESK